MHHIHTTDQLFMCVSVLKIMCMMFRGYFEYETKRKKKTKFMETLNAKASFSWRVAIWLLLPLLLRFYSADYIAAAAIVVFDDDGGDDDDDVLCREWSLRLLFSMHTSTSNTRKNAHLSQRRTCTTFKQQQTESEREATQKQRKKNRIEEFITTTDWTDWLTDWETERETMVATNDDDDDTRQIKTTHGTQTHRLSLILLFFLFYIALVHNIQIEKIRFDFKSGQHTEDEKKK